MTLGARRTFLLSTPGTDKHHLWFGLSDPEGEPPRFVAVMIQSVKNHTENSLVLQRGDHGFIRHDSSVQFKTAGFFFVHVIDEWERRDECKANVDMSSVLLQRVRTALLASPFTSNAVLRYCQQLGW